MSRLSFFLCILFVFACLRAQCYGGQSRQAEKHAALFIFGDSLYDPGNNNYLNVSYHLKADRWPYGETFFNYSTGRFCDGRILPDFVSVKANLPLSRPYLESGSNLTMGTNFASAGAGVFDDTRPGVISLGMQLSYFKMVAHQLRQELGKKKAKKLLMEAVYLSSIAGNDYNEFYETYPNATESEQQEYVEVVVANFTGVIKEIYKIGGRKFAFQNIAPMGCLPAIRQTYGAAIDECVEQLLTLARLHNTALLAAVEELESRLKGFKYSVLDVYTPLYDIVKNPSSYGFVTSNFACCGSGVYNASDCGIAPYASCQNPSEYVYFDGSHPTEAVEHYLTELFWSENKTLTKPVNLKQLFDLESDFSSSESYNLFSDE